MKQKFEVKVIDYNTISLNDTIILKRVQPCSSTRCVYMNDKYVFKWDYYDKTVRWDQRQCLQEAIFYTTMLKKEDRRYFAKLVQHGSFKSKILSEDELYYTIQIRAYETRRYVDFEERESLNKLVTEVTKKYDLHDVGVVCSDGKGHNIILNRRGNIKMYDYASIPALNYFIKETHDNF